VGAVLKLMTGEPASTYDLEVEVPKLVYERLNVASDRRWSVDPSRLGSVLPATNLIQ
jgi:hypothetical protein